MQFYKRQNIRNVFNVDNIILNGDIINQLKATESVINKFSDKH